MVEFNALADQADEIADLLTKVDALEAQAVIDRRDIETLHIALDTARRIGAAMGIVMHTHRVTEDDAFEILRTASQNSNRKLRDIADDVVRTGAVPG